MSEDFIKYRSTIQSTLVKKYLFRGTFLAGIGSAFLLFSGTFLSPSILASWGFLIFLISLGLIALGLVPYRRLKQLENQPHELMILDEKQLLFCWKRKPTFTIPFKAIEKASYIVIGDVYGIGLFLVDSSLRPIKLYDEKFDLAHFQKQSIKKYGCDLFLPYFSERTFGSIFQTE